MAAVGHSDGVQEGGREWRVWRYCSGRCCLAFLTITAALLNAQDYVARAREKVVWLEQQRLVMRRRNSPPGPAEIVAR